MKIQAFVIAAALASGAAFAAAPTHTAKAADTVTTTMTKKVATKHHKKVTKVTRTSRKHRHTVHHAAMHRESSMGSSSAPQTDVIEKGRQERMDEALAKYRQRS